MYVHYTASTKDLFPKYKILNVRQIYIHITGVCSDGLNQTISILEIAEAVQRLKNGKTFDVDFIRNEHIKETRLLLPLWCDLFNEILRHGSIPEEWMSSIVVMIPKGKGLRSCIPAHGEE